MATTMTLLNMGIKTKLQRIFLTVLTIGFLSCSNKNNTITVNGKVNGEAGDKIEYTVPINGAWFFGAKRTVELDSIGNFSFSMKIDSASFVTLYVPRKAVALLLVEPNNTYEVDLDLDSKSKKFKINGEQSDALDLFNSFAHPDFATLYTSNELLKDSTLSSISEKIKARHKNEMSHFKELLDSGQITKDFYDLANRDRKIYYLALKGEIASSNYNLPLNKQNPKNAQTMAFWKEVFETNPLTDSFLLSTPWSFPLMKNYIKFNQYNTDSYNPDKEGKFHNINHAKKYLKGKPLEYYYADYILSNSFSNKENSKELIDLFENFKKEYPNSLYSKHIESFIKPIVDFHKKLETKKRNEKVQLINDYQNIDSFNELVQKFKGQKLFVDIWGTWCAPCKREFAHKDALNKLLDSKGITSLYICEGTNSKEHVWKEMINFYELEGSHIRTNKKLLKDILDKFGTDGNFAYPRYLLVDENGKVVNDRASYPSKTKQLEKEINEAYAR